MAASASLEPAATAALLNFKNNSRLFSSLKDPETTNVIAEREGSQRGLTHELNFAGQGEALRERREEKHNIRRWEKEPESFKKVEIGQSGRGDSNRAYLIPPLIHVHLQTIKALLPGRSG